MLDTEKYIDERTGVQQLCNIPRCPSLPLLFIGVFRKRTWMVGEGKGQVSNRVGYKCSSLKADERQSENIPFQKQIMECENMRLSTNPINLVAQNAKRFTKHSFLKWLQVSISLTSQSSLRTCPSGGFHQSFPPMCLPSPCEIRDVQVFLPEYFYQ